MAEKETKLNIVIRTVDRATAKLQAINDRLDAITKPIRNFKDALGGLRESSGLDSVIGGFKGVGSAVGELLSKVAMVGGIVGLAVAGVFHLVGEFEDLGKKAARLGVGVDFLAEMRDAAERAGAPVEALDEGMQAFSQNLGQASAGVGRMTKFLGTVSPALLQQLKSAKGTEAAFFLLADAMAKIQDPAKRAALAQKTLGDSALAPMLALGSKRLKEMGVHYDGLAGSQEGAAKSAGEVHESMLDLKAATDGVKASIVEGLAPALAVIVKRLSDWFAGHRQDVKDWAMYVGERLPDAFNAVVDAVGTVVDTLEPFFNSATKIKIALGVLAAIMVGPLVSAIATLGVALLTTPIGWFLGGIALLGGAAYEIIKHWEPIKKFFVGLWDGITGAFKDAWEVISGIVDKIKGALDGLIGDDFGGIVTLAKQAEDKNKQAVSAKVDQAVAVARQQQTAAAFATAPEARTAIKIDFANAPKGTRVSTAPGSTADIDLNVGYATGWMPGS